MSVAPAPESGFTLVELLISLAVLTLIMAVIGTALAVALRTSSDTGTFLGQSNTQLIVTGYLTDDIAGACNPGLLQCNSPNPYPTSSPNAVGSTDCTPTPCFVVESIVNAPYTARDTWTTYSLSGGQLWRTVTGARTTSVAIADNVTGMAWGAPLAGAPANCNTNGLFTVEITVAGSTSARQPYPPYSFYVCAKARTS